MTSQEDSYRLIPLTQGQFATVDECDYKRITMYRWYAHRPKSTGKFYAVRDVTINGDGHRYGMQWQVLGIPWNGSELIDHKNHNPLDNRQSNLRTATEQQNLMNRTGTKNKCGFKGVGKKGNKFRAYIKHNRKGIHLGTFSTPELAHEAYYAAACKLFGEFACH